MSQGSHPDLCVDDHPIVRERIAKVLAAARAVPGVTEEAALAVRETVGRITWPRTSVS